MANVAKYDRDEVVRKAMLLFWEKGFNGTSTRDLQQDIDMRPGSIYAAFGSKEGLFSEALEYYSREMKQILDLRSTELQSPLAGLEAFMRNVVVDRRDTNPSEFCMLVKTLSELNEDQPELMQQTRKLLKRTEDRFTDILERAQKQDEISASANPRMLAQQLQVQMIGLRAFMKANRNPNTVSELIDSIFSSIRIH
ncbi:TetR/AcrR family transcriptional regulator [Amphritea balenae]|nr:TetR/AcrR family transcriptional regulator [Amphritea balenae]GGK79162.1 TetR family transcriptional regulator [Amphritea balenae]